MAVGRRDREIAMIEIRTEDVLYTRLEGLFHDRLDRRFRVVDISAPEADLLGRSGATLAGSPASTIYDARTLDRLAPLLAASSGRPVCCPVTLLHIDGSSFEFAALVVPEMDDEGVSCLDIYKAEAIDLSDEFQALVASNKVMWGIIQMAREAIWCIDYEEPVDVTGSQEEIVDGIFEQPSVWSICNEAMARAYDLPGAAHLSTSSVRFHWPRNPINEAFVREVIAKDFRVDGALSEDYRLDGTPVLVENDVRAHIVGGKLHRLWGTLREVEPAQRVSAPESDALAASGFDLLPIAAAIIASDGVLLGANGLWQATFAGAPDPVERIVYRGLAGTGETSSSGGLLAPIVVMLRERDGAEGKLYSVHGRWHNPGRNGRTLLVVTATPVAGEYTG